ncbi:AAA family ATPase [Streptomyces noursei]|uniref:AAA family ATPase n=1 Tax=Streptomyces noursei TaxID=1971 RepID=UPI001678F9A5|nr:AAA family ATPase [Streptomyces noursei]MCZ1019422.1 AAA family ATPase [Streptomyces noursei]
MFSLNQSVRMRGAAGEPIPSPFKGLRKLEVEFRRGDFSVVCAGGGTGKSLTALWLAVSSNVPTLYFSADSTAATQLSRATAMITGDSAKEVKKKLVSEGEDFEQYSDALMKRWWLRFNYSARPNPKEIETHLECYREVFGIYPHLVVIDNITNVDGGGAGTAEEYTFGLEGLCDYFNEMARETHAHVMAMHHVVGEFSSGNKPIPLSGVKGKIGRVPSLVLTIHAEVDGMNGRTLHISPVKNREGFTDPSGETYSSYEVNTSNLHIADVEEEVF